MILSGIFIGTNNTITTQAVMTVAPVPRPTASASYGFIRFIGGGIAPWAAGKIAASHGDHLPFYIGAAAIAAAIGVLATGHRELEHAHAGPAVPEPLDSGLEVA